MSSNRNGFVPDPAQAFEDAPEVLAPVGTERSGDVFPDRKSWIFAIGSAPHFFYNSYRLIEQARPRTVKTAAFSGNAHILARTAERDYIHWRQICSVQRGHISIMLHLRKSFRCYPNGERFDFRSPQRSNASKHSSERETAAAVKKAAKREFILHRRPPVRNKQSSFRPAPQTHRPQSRPAQYTASR